MLFLDISAELQRQRRRYDGVKQQLSTSATTRWEAFKAYIRGQMISFTGSKFNTSKQKMNELDTEIGEVERAVCLDNSVPTKQNLLALRA